MKTGELFKKRLNLAGGVLGVCQSIDDGGGGMKFSKNICEPSKISLLCIYTIKCHVFSKWASIVSTSSNPDAALPIVCRFTQPCLTCFSLAHKIDGTKETWGAHVNILTETPILFFGFEIWPNPIFLGWQIFSYFSGFRKISSYFFGLPITHLNPWNEEHMVLKNIKSQ